MHSRITSVTAFSLAAIMISASRAKADTFIEGFDAAPNQVGGWSFGIPVTYPTSGGNPGIYQRTQGLDSFAPQPRTAPGNISIFTGNYRTANVSSVGIDLKTFAVDFSAADRPLSVMLTSDNGTPGNASDDWAAYNIGPGLVPVPGDPWKSFDFNIPSQSTSLPTGWHFMLLGPNSPANPDWNYIITHVVQLKYFYGDPTNFFIFQNWTLGIDNPRVTTTPPSGPGDVNGDGTVNVDDLLAVINAWGSCPAPPATCPADLNNTGAVNVDDLLLVINHWS